MMGDTAAFTVTKQNVEDDRALLQVNKLRVQKMISQMTVVHLAALFSDLEVTLHAQHGVVGTGTAVERQPILDHYIPAHPVDR